MKIISWNINGYRAILKKGFFDFIKKESPDILALQETKVNLEQLKENDYKINNYNFIFNSAKQKGYSGVAVFSKENIKNINTSLGFEKFDIEGRIIQVEYEKFYFLNVYFPNGGRGEERIKYKLEFYDTFLQYIEKLRKTKKAVIFCGDVNTAHNEIDLSRPKENEKNTGFLRIERDWLDKITNNGWVDTFRHFNKEGNNYTWWDYKTKARERNIGWRIDYFFIDKEHLKNLKDAFILKDVLGSDHCPLGIKLNF